jgi:hypothetical protein
MILCIIRIVPATFMFFLLHLTCSYGEDNGKLASFEILEQGGNSGVRTGKAIAIHDAASWNTLWLEHKKNSTLASAAPAVDFSKQMVVAVFLGERRTGGYAVHIQTISAESGGLNVAYQERRPGKDCILIMAITFPYQIVRVARVDGPVTFSPELRIQNCSIR